MSARAGLALVAALAAAAAAAGCTRDAPITDEAIARDAFIHRLTEREGLTGLWALLARIDIVFEDGFGPTLMVDPRVDPGWRDTLTPGKGPPKIAVRFIGPAAHLRVRGRGGDMRLRIWGRVNTDVLFNRPRITVTFDRRELWSQIVGDDGAFDVTAVIPAAQLDGWSDVYVKMSSVHEPWRDPTSLRVGRVEGVEWEPAR